MTAITRAWHPRPEVLVVGLLAALAVGVPLSAIVGGDATFVAAGVAVVAGIATLALADRVLVGGGDAIRLAGASGVLLAVPTALLAVPIGAGIPIERVAGPDRVATALAVSREAFARASEVVVVGGGSPADAVVAARLAADVGGPLLFAGDGLAAEVRRLGAERALVVGRPVVLPDLPAGVVPIARPDRYATSSAVAARIQPDRVYVTSSWASALAVPVRRGEAVLLVPPDRLPQMTIRSLQRIRPGTVVVLDARPNVVTFLRALLPDADVRRRADSEPIGTRGAAAWPWVAAASSWPDAVVAGVAAATDGRPLVLVPAADDGEGWLRQNRDDISEITVVGTGVTDAELTRALRGSAAADTGPPTRTGPAGVTSDGQGPVASAGPGGGAPA